MKKENSYTITESQLMELNSNTNDIRSLHNKLREICNSPSTLENKFFLLGQLSYDFNKLLNQTEYITDKIYYQNPEKKLIINLKDFKEKPRSPDIEFFDENGNADILEMLRKIKVGWWWFFYNANNFDWFDSESFDWDSASDLVVLYCPEHFDSEKYNWKAYSAAIVQHAPQFFDTNKYNWYEDSSYIVKHCPEHFDSEKYNWKGASKDIVEFAPHLFDSKKFFWNKENEEAVKEYCPHLLRFKPMKINLKDLKQTPPEKYLKYFDKEGNADVLETFEKEEFGWLWLFINTKNFDWFNPDEFDWKKVSWAIALHAPQLFDTNKYNWSDFSKQVAKFCPEHFDAERFNWHEASWAIAQYAPEHFDEKKFVWNEYSELKVRKHCPHLIKFKKK